MTTIRNPIEWGVDQLRHAATHAASVGRSVRGISDIAPLPAVRKISVGDLKEVLAKGLADFGACRSDVLFLGIVYPLIGIVLARFAFHLDLLPLVFPLASGFALLGPAAAVGLYEMSRRREEGLPTNWADAFGPVRAPSFGAIFLLGLVLLAIFLTWLLTAQAIYHLTLGPEPPASFSAFARDVFTTAAGWAMIVVGVAAGAVFAVLVLSISVVSFPLLLDRDVGIGTAIRTSIAVTRANPVPVAAWGLIVAISLAIASLPVFLGLIVVMPILGHATWHLYRKTVAAQP